MGHLCEERYWLQCKRYDYTAYMDYMNLDIRRPKKAVKLNHSITHFQRRVSSILTFITEWVNLAIWNVALRMGWQMCRAPLWQINPYPNVCRWRTARPTRRSTPPCGVKVAVRSSRVRVSLTSRLGINHWGLMDGAQMVAEQIRGLQLTDH